MSTGEIDKDREQCVALITGANNGIGLATVKEFLNKGYRIIAHYNTAKDNIDRLDADELSTVQADLSVTKNVRDLFETVIKSHERIHILVNNAGTSSAPEDIENISIEEMNYVLDVNLKAPFVLSQLALLHMKKAHWGRIINISSIGIKFGGNPSTVSYTVSKAALEAMTIAFAKAGAPYNVLVNAIRVGVIDTKFHTHDPTKDLGQRAKLIPLGRTADPSEIAKTVEFLASENASFTTGSIVTTAGGE